MDIAIALFTHCQDSFGSDLQNVLGKKYQKIKFIYPSTHNTDDAVTKIKNSTAFVAIVDTASISGEMAQELVGAIKKNSPGTLVFSHSGNPIEGVSHLNNNEELLEKLTQ